MSLAASVFRIVFRRPGSRAALLAAIILPAAAVGAPVLSDVPQVQHFSKGPGAFVDLLSFELDAPGILDAKIASFDMVGTPGVLLRIESFDVSLFDSLNQPVGAWRGSPASFSSGLGAGQYRLQVAGTASGLYGGLYTTALAVTPIPEPEAWALMGSGLLLLALRARRRKSPAAETVT